MGVVVRRYIYIDFLILLIRTTLVAVLFCSSIPTFCSFYLMFFVFFYSAVVYTVEPPITDPPRGGQPPYSGQSPWHGLKSLPL